MKQQTLVIMIYLLLIIIALLLNKPVSAFFAFLCGSALMAMYQYGGERLRRILKSLLVG